MLKRSTVCRFRNEAERSRESIGQKGSRVPGDKRAPAPRRKSFSSRLDVPLDIYVSRDFYGAVSSESRRAYTSQSQIFTESRRRIAGVSVFMLERGSSPLTGHWPSWERWKNKKKRLGGKIDHASEFPAHRHLLTQSIYHDRPINGRLSLVITRRTLRFSGSVRIWTADFHARLAGKRTFVYRVISWELRHL